MDKEKIESYSCPIEAFMGVLGGKYKAIIAYELIGRTLRYSEIARLVPKATPRIAHDYRPVICVPIICWVPAAAMTGLVLAR